MALKTSMGRGAERGAKSGPSVPAPLPAFELALEDRQALQRVLQEGSRSFYFASRLLPPRLRDSVLVYYAYCRRADDAIDEAQDPGRALEVLRRELDDIFDKGSVRSRDDRVASSLARLVSHQHLTRAPFEGLLEGFAWDAGDKCYETLDDLEQYCARVAGTVGITMTQLMGTYEPHMLARAADLGVAMQLTNISRDVGSDARMGRVYVPRRWWREANVDVDLWGKEPVMRPEIADFVRRLLSRAELLYRRSEAGIAALPADCRASIYAARLIYADIGRSLLKIGFDSVNQRAFVGRGRKLWLLAWARIFAVVSDPADLELDPLPATRWLCE